MRFTTAVHIPRLVQTVIRPLVIVTVAASSACAPSFPPIAATGGDSVLKARIATMYPPGSSGARLRDDLAREGFTVLYDPATRLGSALDRPPNLPCLSETRIDWRENARGRIVLIQAARHVCS